MRGLTKRQEEVLGCVRRYVRERGVAPSRSEIAEEIGVTNSTTIDSHLAALMRKGWVELKSGSPRYIRLLKEDLPLVAVGPIPAGQSVLAEERVVRTIPAAVGEMFSPRADYFVEVQGDSMDRMGLVDGAQIAVKTTEVAKSGDIVVARYLDELMVRVVRVIGYGNVELCPASTNPVHTPKAVVPGITDFEIVGVGIGAFIRFGVSALLSDGDLRGAREALLIDTSSPAGPSVPQGR